MKRGQSRADQNKAIRQEALRQQLIAGGHVQHVIDICEELNDLSRPLEAVDVQRKKVVIDTKLKIINKYIPDVKAASQLVEFDFTKGQKPHEQAASVLNAIATGLIPSDIGSTFIQSIKTMIDIEEYDELKARIEEIEKTLNINA